MVTTDLFIIKRRISLSLSLFLIAFFALHTSTLHAQAVACNNNVQVSLNPDCEADITPGMILEGEDEADLPDFAVTIAGVSGTIVTNPGIYSVTVTNTITGNYCWGTINVEDKLPPVIEDCACPVGNDDPDCSFFCTDYDAIQAGTFDLPQPVVYEGCTSFESEYSDLVTEGTCGQKIITRSWLFTDDAGNQASGCVQEFTLEPITIADILDPVSPVIMTCGQDVSMQGIVNYFTPSVGLAVAYTYAFPTVNGVPIQGAVCNLAATKTDLVIPVCDQACSNSIKVLRKWTILDWCNATTMEFTQIIKSVDEEPPTISANDITVSTDPWICEASFFLPAPTILHDACTPFVDYIVTGPAGATIVWNAMVNKYAVSGLPKGVHTLTYIASDCCDNTASDAITVTVVDKTPPVAIAKQFIVISLTQANIGTGSAKMYAESVDNGSHDGCTGVKLEIRRDKDACSINGNATYNNDGHPFDSNTDPDQGKYVKFCCNDLTVKEVDVDGDGELDAGHIKVWLRVWDDGDMNGVYGSAGDNYNEAWVAVKVEDKLDPVLTCPSDVTIGCKDDANDLTSTGTAQAFTACGPAEVTYTDNVSGLDGCGIGFITRRWTVVGNSQVFCNQRITIAANGYFNGNITWPADYTTDCNGLDNDDEPTWGDAGCSLVGYSLESDTFQFEENACFKIINYWTVIDWCQYNPNTQGSTGMWQHAQIIKVLDDVAPVMTCSNQMYAVDDYQDADNDGTKCEIIGLQLKNIATDNGDCASAWLKWTIKVDLWGDGTYDYEYSSLLPPSDASFNDTNGNGIPDRYVAPTASGQEVTITIPEHISSSMSNHKVEWSVSDGCGNVKSCSNTFMVVDKKAPTPYCIDINTALMESGMVELWACDFDLGSFDNCTDNENLRFTFTPVRPENDPKFNNAVGCSSRIFDCEDLENSPLAIEMYVWDEKGNSDFCEVMLTLIDNQDGCDDGNKARITGTVKTPQNETIEGAKMTLEAVQQEYFKEEYTSVTGGFSFTSNPLAVDFKLEGRFDGQYSDGVSTLDLVMIQRHILGIASFEDAFKVIAADINNDEKISASDLLQLRKLILGVISEYPNNSAYHLLPAAQGFADISNPWPFVNKLLYLPLNDDMDDQDFVAIKVGDVNHSATYGLTMKAEAEVRGKESLSLQYEKLTTVDEQGHGLIAISYQGGMSNMLGMQAAISLKSDDIHENDVRGISSGALTIEEGDFYIVDNTLFLSLSYPLGVDLKTGDDLFYIKTSPLLSDMVDVSIDNRESIASEAYDMQLAILPLDITRRSADIGNKFDVSQNEPNPFDAATTITYYLPTEGEAMISISNANGQHIYTQQLQSKAGRNTFVVNEKMLSGSGIYYYTITSGSERMTKKMVYIK